MATPKELFENLRDDLKALEWIAGNKVFGDSVRVVPEFPLEQIARFSNSRCFLIDNGSVAISNHNQLHEQRFNISYFVQNFVSQSRSTLSSSVIALMLL